LKPLLNYAGRRLSSLLRISGLIGLIIIISSCQPTRIEDPPSSPSSEKLYIILEGTQVDVVGEPNLILPYDGIIMSDADYFEMMEK